MTIVNYYGKLKTIWDELEMYELILTCSCKACKCEISKKLQQRREDEHVHQFLLGLDIVYGTARLNLLATDPLPSLNRIYSTLVQEERLRSMARAVDEHRDVMALMVQTLARGKGRVNSKDTTMVCFYCNHAGQNSSNCFQVIGCPNWWGDKP